MKVKINQLEGIITNIDTADLKPQAVVDSQNVQIWNGYASVDFPKLVEVDLPAIVDGYTWETGTYAKIGGDILSKNFTPIEYTIIFLVAKKDKARKFYFKKVEDTAWVELNIASGLTYLTSNFFTTTIDGEVFFLNQNGILKIFTPGDSFWFGYLDRKIYTDNEPVIYKGFYLDRLVEKVDLSSSATTVSNGQVVCAAGHRIGMKFTPTIITDSKKSLDITCNVKFKYLRTETYNAGTSTECKLIVCNLYYTSGDEIGTLITNPFTTDYSGGQSTEWCFWKCHDLQYIDGIAYDGYFAPNNILEVIKNIEGTTRGIHNPQISSGGTLAGDYTVFFYQLTGWDITTVVNKSTYQYTASSISISGFDNTKEIGFITTCILDETTEIAVDYKLLDTSAVTVSKFGVDALLEIPTNFNRRVTRVRLYAFRDAVDTDFQLIYEYNLIGEFSPLFSGMIVGKGQIDKLGTTLSSNIAFAIDKDDLTKYQIVYSFRSFTIKDNIGIGLRYDDVESAYYSVLGGGNLQPDLIYTGNILPITFRDKLIAVTSINNNLAAIGTNSLTILKADNVNNSLIFSAQDTLEYGIKDLKQVVEVQGGIIIFTCLGIFLTNGYDKHILSENINQDVKALYNDSYILYNPYKQELYIWGKTSPIKLWLYSFERQAWERSYFSDRTLIAPLLDFDGNLNFLVSK